MYVCIFSSCLFAQELKNWEEVECDSIENIGVAPWSFNVDGTTPYLINDPMSSEYICKFQATKDHVTLKEALIFPRMLGALKNQCMYVNM